MYIVGLSVSSAKRLSFLGVDALPARKLYEEVFPDVIARLTDPNAPHPYHRGSPYGGKGWDTSDPTVGDVVRKLRYASPELRSLIHIFSSTNGMSGQDKGWALIGKTTMTLADAS